MTEIEEYNILMIVNTYKNMCISMDTYCEFIKETRWADRIDPTTQLNLLKQGYFANIGACSIWVSKIIAPNHIRVSNQEISIAKDETKWSPECAIADFDMLTRLHKLKAFW